MRARLYAKHFTGLILLNPLKVALLSSFDQEISLERLSHSLKVLHLKMTEPKMELYPSPGSKDRVFNLDIKVPAIFCGHTGAEKWEECASKAGKVLV